MKDRIVFFILGAVLATLAYYAGSENNVDADGELVVKQLTVTDSLILLGDAAVDGRLLVNERFEVGLEPNKPRIMMEVDSNQAQIIVTENADEDVSNQHYIHLIAGKHPNYGLKSAGIRMKEGEHKSLHLSPE